MEMKTLGIHIFADTWGGLYSKLNDMEYLKSSMDVGVVEGFLTVIRGKISYHQFSPHGITITYPLEESHFTIHTWPEYEHAMIDILSCGDNSRPHKTMWHMINKIEPREGWVNVTLRGNLIKNDAGLYVPMQRAPKTDVYPLVDYMAFVHRTEDIKA